MKRPVLLGTIVFVLALFGFMTAHFLAPQLFHRQSIQADNLNETGSISRVAKELSPSIVGIACYGVAGDFFSRRTVEKSGSGVIIDPSGFIVTNNHVVQNSDRIVVVLPNEQQKEARLVGGDSRTDLALLKVNAVGFKAARLGNSDNLVVGQSVVAIGNPMGIRFARSVTAGVISGLNRLLTTEEGLVFRLIQTDAAINPGNSGGALANLAGEVVGINTIKIAVPGFEGMGFAIPANQVKQVIKELQSRGRVVRPVAGLEIVSEITDQEAKYYNLPVTYGVAVVPIKEGPSAKAGIKNYDIIQAVNGHRVKSAYDMQDCMFRCQVGDEVTLRVIRIPRDSGQKLRKLDIKVKLDGSK